MREAARLAELEAENARLRAQVDALSAQVQARQARQARLAQESHTSSKPPASAGLSRKTKSLRRKSGKQPGGQLGHRGETLRLVATPDQVVEPRPAVCAYCQTPLAGEPVVLRERRQVSEWPAGRLVGPEHQALHVRCPACQQVSAGSWPAEAPSRAQDGPPGRALAVYVVEAPLVPLGRGQQLLAALVGRQRARGTLVAWIQQAATVVAPVEAAIKTARRQVPVRHRDETGVRRAGRLAWAHVARTARLTPSALHAHRGAEASDAMGLLPAYSGVSVQDGLGSYRASTRCRHARGNIHHLRELTFLDEADLPGRAGAAGLGQGAQSPAAHHADRRRPGPRPGLAPRACASGPPPSACPCLPATRTSSPGGLAANPPPVRPAGPRGRLAQSPARNLLERLHLDQEQGLAFLDDLTLPFDNNQAERDRRALKVQQKGSGCFRAPRGADAFARLRGYLSTLRKQGYALLAARETVFAGQPLYPALA